MNSGRRILARETILGLILAAGLFRLALFLGSALPGLQRIELNYIDERFRRSADLFSLARSPIVIVDIDDDSYKTIPAVWPWPRSYYARLITNLSRAGARLIVLDIILDKERPDNPTGDDSLAAAIRESGNVILSGKSSFIKSKFVKEQRPYTLLPYGRFLTADSSNWGLVDIPDDMDGVVRRYFTRRVLPGSAQRSPSLALRAYTAATNAAHAFESGPTFYIAYPGEKEAFPYYPFYQVVDDATLWTKGEEEWGEENNWFDTLYQEGRFKDKIVFVGSSITELQDFKPTPFSRTEGSRFLVPGVEIHAAALHTLLNGYHIRESDPLTTHTILALICLALFLLTVTTRTWIYFPAALLFAALWYEASFRLFSAYSILLPITKGLVCIGLVTVGQMGYLFYLEQLRRKKVTGMFGRYVPKEVVRELIKDPDKMRLGGERRELTVLFSDIEGFTTLSESMPPEALVELLNEYLTAMTAVVHDHGGIIDKYEGDLIMAEFGIPLMQPDHSLSSCRAAFQMQKRLHGLREEWTRSGKPLLRARIGIGTGPMVFGNMGSNQAFDYTVIGDVVNLASRLEGANRTYGTAILINEPAFRSVEADMLCREMDLLRVKGRITPEKCYQLMAPNDSPKADQIRRVIDLFSEGISRYRGRQWEAAIDRFNGVLEIWKDDTPSQVYISRCRHFVDHPPGREWSGVWVMETK